MIPTRLHGVIDYAVSAALFGLSTSRALPTPVRRVLATAGAGHVSYSVLTDYEGGAYPALTMREHLALDAAAAAAICGAGLLMRRQPAGARALLIGIGLAELAVVAASSATPVSGPGQDAGPAGPLLGHDEATAADQVGYPPLDTPKPVAEDVFVVDSLLPGMLGAVLPVRMTVIRLPDGSLLLHSPTRFSHPLKQKLEELGPILHLVAPSIAHWQFLEAWQRACPGAITWAAPGLRERSQVRRSGVRLDHDLHEAPPLTWGDAMAMVTVEGGMGFHEVALFHRPTRTLMLTDLAMRLEAPKVPAPLRPLIRMFGTMAPDSMPPPYLRAVVKLRRQEAAEAAWRLLDLQPERVIFAHGRWFERDGAAELRHSLRWLLG
ncbi:DUF4336 domain-containing protein [Roseomonas sp. E05]|uniref:DUF4336 domain-containing protein n=1 Tax=Roseomonas sp. E05 TaxID=3046310 RepID=UPI0024BAA936|nr:DUF4336 domain-containing protein [Roseomonas sp. E05]MDJ0389878.1 DUF4336 domain-containing protein [Roseomonas sp. E05]